MCYTFNMCREYVFSASGSLIPQQTTFVMNASDEYGAVHTWPPGNTTILMCEILDHSD